MKLTTFFIDRFTEVSFPSPQGLQEEGGLYGNDPNYSTWLLGESGDTADFLGITRTNILYGELYKITLDTGDFFNNPIVGGPQNPYGFATPNINEFMNMDPNEYWGNITAGLFTFNDTTYDQYRATLPPVGIPMNRIPGRGTGGPGGGTGGPGGGTGGPGGPTGIPSPTLLEYAMGVKERIGWVEVNRTRASIYYEYCFDGKRARVDHFYDATQFIMTPELFDPLFIPKNTLAPLNLFSYQGINPYRPDDRYFTQSPTGISSKKLGLTPVDTWFTWENNAQTHRKIIKNVPLLPNTAIGGFTTFPWPMGPNWGQVSTEPNDYLMSLVMGNHVVLDGNLNEPPFQTKMAIPFGVGSTVTNLPLLIAQKEKHLNQLMDQRLTTTNEFGTVVAISPEYSVDIWGEKRIPEELSNISMGFYSVSDPSTYGPCQPIPGLESEDVSGDVIVDPYGFDLYNLDKEFKSLYDRFKFCPPRKKTKVNMSKRPVPIQAPNRGQITKVTTTDTEEYIVNTPEKTTFIKIGAFNPDQKIFFDTTGYENFDITQIGFQLQHQRLEPTFQYATETGDSDVTPNDDDFNTLSYLVGTPKTGSFLDDTNYSFSKNAFRNDLNKYIQNNFEISYGIRNIKDLIVSNPNIPYGTLNVNVEKNISTTGTGDLSIDRVVTVSQNGSDADPQEFKNAVSSVTSIGGRTDDDRLKPVGVLPNGFPLYPKNTVEESIRDIVEQLTGIKEIYFRGSEVNYGAVSHPKRKYDYLGETPSAFRYVPEKYEYVNTGITISGKVDVSKRYNNKVAYTHKRFNFEEGVLPENLTKNQFMGAKESTLDLGEIDFIGTYSSWNTNIVGPNIKDPMPDITHIIVSKFDILGKPTTKWAPTSENTQGVEIVLSKTGSLFLTQKGPFALAATYQFRIIGNPISFNTYYKIPVKFLGQTQSGKGPIGTVGDNNVRYTTIDVVYSSDPAAVTEPKPVDTTSKENTYGGWIFNGLWHRNGEWPLDHKFRSGLLGTTNWTPLDGGVNTGAWIRVPSQRVLLEYHDFNINGRDSVYAYIHSLWLLQNDKIFNQKQILDLGQKITDPVAQSPYTESNPQFMLRYEPDPLREDEWEDWEKIFDTQRKYLLEQLEQESNRVLILRLRDNDADPSRGLKQLIFPKIDQNDDATRAIIARKPGHLLETWIIANNIVEDDRIMDMGANYGMRWYPEPTEHTLGTFKKDEWYRAVFTRAIVSPSKPNGEVAGLEPTGRPGNGISSKQLFLQKKLGKYRPTENNKKIFCDTLYATEQIFKMHRARLIEMKKYVDAKIKFSENTTSERSKISFRRSMEYVTAVRNITRTVK